MTTTRQDFYYKTIKQLMVHKKIHQEIKIPYRPLKQYKITLFTFVYFEFRDAVYLKKSLAKSNLFIIYL